jgi:TIR domain
VAGRLGEIEAPAPPPQSRASRPESHVAIWTIRSAIASGNERSGAGRRPRLHDGILPLMTRVFLSYARADGEAHAAQVRERLAREASDIMVQQDRLLLEGGIGWWKQITDAMDSVKFLILVVTRAAIASGNVQKEWRYARQQGVCVYPVKGRRTRNSLFPKCRAG